MSQALQGQGTLVLVLVVAGAYLLGSVPFGLLVARFAAGVDVRSGGSGNIGATNVARVAGRPLGVLTLLLDAAKGLVPVLVMGALAAPPAATGEAAGPEQIWIAAAGAAAFLGHCFSPFLLLRGGKGVATALGVLIVTAPWAALGGALTYALLFLVFRLSSMGSLVAVTVAIPVAFLTAGPIFGALSAFMGVIVIAKHHENIKRLLSGSEQGL